MLKAFESHQIVLADYGEMPNFSSSAYQFISLGEKNEDTIAHNLINNCLNEGVDWILPLHSFEIMALAKASILFSEFNLAILLPSLNDLSLYFDVNDTTKYTNWALFRDGEVLFMSFTDDRIASFAKNSSLSGAFYINNQNTVANLTLITI